MIHSLLAEFERPDELLRAAGRVREEGYLRFDAYSPMHVHGLAEAMGLRPTRLPLLVLLGGLAGGAAGYALQYWTSVVDFPLDVGGRPYHSWPAFLVVTFETTVLAAALTAVLGMLALNGLPRPHHPVFNAPAFRRASQDRFFLAIEARDPRFDPERTRDFLRSLGPLDVHEVQP